MLVIVIVFTVRMVGKIKSKILHYICIGNRMDETAICTYR